MLRENPFRGLNSALSKAVAGFSRPRLSSVTTAMRNVALSAIRKRLPWKDSERFLCRNAGNPYNVSPFTRGYGLGFVPKIQYRGAKSRATIAFEDLPKDTSTAELSIPKTEYVGPAYPAMVQQARDNMQKFDKCVLLTRVGGFYELYFEHAEKYGPLLNIKVAQRKTAAGSVPMAGFPFIHLERYLRILVQDLNEFVAISEEFPNTISGTVKSGGLCLTGELLGRSPREP